ncbi:MAG: putative redox protein [Flavobacteriaceae bacterium]|jgi:putative redox protein
MKLSFTRRTKPFVFEVVNASGATCVIDASESIGGLNQGFRPMELLASSLAGCLSIDLLFILQKQRKYPSIFSIEIEASRVETVPSPFDQIMLHLQIDEELNNEALSRMIDLVLAKYCSVSASLSESIKINYTINKQS